MWKVVGLVIGLAAGLSPSLAREGSVNATYDVRWLGLRIATARIQGGFENGAYKLEFESRYSVLLSSGTITGRVAGRLVGDRLLPQSYQLAATGSPERRSAITFENGTARSITIEPPLEPDWNEGRVVLQPQHQRNVLDPMSGLVLAALRAGAGVDEACKTVVPVFSGVTRFDVALQPSEPPVTRASAGGGGPRAGTDVISCRIRFVPIAGHRPVNQTIRALQAANAMRIDFERQPTGAVRLPRQIEIPTRYGTVSIRRTG